MSHTKRKPDFVVGLVLTAGPLCESAASKIDNLTSTGCNRSHEFELQTCHILS